MQKGWRKGGERAMKGHELLSLSSTSYYSHYVLVHLYIGRHWSALTVGTLRQTGVDQGLQMVVDLEIEQRGRGRGVSVLDCGVGLC